MNKNYVCKSYLKSNYRPVSLASLAIKTIEHIICTHLVKHFEKHNILTYPSYGFGSGFSTEHNF